jgi:DNA repair exonuclease SbcCD nuclease subunit
LPFRFVHTADIHLDSPLRSLALRNPALATLVGDSTRQALVAIVDLCLDQKVDALVIAGDLYDGDQTSMKTARFLATQLGRLDQAGIAVFKVRGNHDALSKITQELILPPGVKVFGGRGETVEITGKGVGVAVHGISFARPHAPESLVPKFRAPVADAVNIAIMHTSLAGAPGHDAYAPCALKDLHESGFDYWALGHVHARTQHAGARTVVMPGMPQGRDINESGPKSVSLVTIGDDHGITVEEWPTSIAQFERIPVDLGGIATWREAVDAIELAIGRERDRTEAPHLVGRLMLSGATPLAWRLRRDRDLLTAEIEQRVEATGRTWIDRIELAVAAPGQAVEPGSADPLRELADLLRGDALGQHGLREAVRDLVRDLRDDLPGDARGFTGTSEEEFEAFVETLIGEAGEDVLARLEADAGGER